MYPFCQSVNLIVGLSVCLYACLVAGSSVFYFGQLFNDDLSHSDISKLDTTENLNITKMPNRIHTEPHRTEPHLTVPHHHSSREPMHVCVCVCVCISVHVCEAHVN